MKIVCRKILNRRNLAVLFQLAVATVLILIAVNYIGLDHLITEIKKISNTVIFIIIFLTILQIILLIWRWSLLSSLYQLKKLTATQLIPGVLVERFANQFLPPPIGGDLLRVAFISSEGQPFMEILKSVLLDRLSGISGMFFIAILALPFLYFLGPSIPGINTLIIFFFLLGISGALVMLLSPKPIETFLRNFNLTKLADLYKEFHSALQNKKFLFSAFVLSFFIQAIFCFIFALIGKSLDPNFPMILTALLVPFILMPLILPISLGGWGIREGTAVFLLGLIGVSPKLALSTSLIFGTTQIIIALLCGIALISFSLFKMINRNFFLNNYSSTN